MVSEFKYSLVAALLTKLIILEVATMDVGSLKKRRTLRFYIDSKLRRLAILYLVSGKEPESFAAGCVGALCALCARIRGLRQLEFMLPVSYTMHPGSSKVVRDVLANIGTGRDPEKHLGFGEKGPHSAEKTASYE